MTAGFMISFPMIYALSHMLGHFFPGVVHWHICSPLYLGVADDYVFWSSANGRKEATGGTRKLHGVDEEG